MLYLGEPLDHLPNHFTGVGVKINGQFDYFETKYHDFKLQMVGIKWIVEDIVGFQVTFRHQCAIMQSLDYLKIAY